MAPPWTAARTPAARSQAVRRCRPDREWRHDLLAAHRRAVPACQRHLRAVPNTGHADMTAAALKRELASIRGTLQLLLFTKHLSWGQAVSCSPGAPRVSAY